MSAISPLGEILQKSLQDMTPLEYCIWYTHEGTTSVNVEMAVAELFAKSARIAELEAKNERLRTALSSARFAGIGKYFPGSQAWEEGSEFDKGILEALQGTE